MKDLWRALALVWLGGMASPALADDLPMFEAAEERPAEAIRSGGPAEAPPASRATHQSARGEEEPPPSRQARSSVARREGRHARTSKGRPPLNPIANALAGMPASGSCKCRPAAASIRRRTSRGRR